MSNLYLDLRFKTPKKGGLPAPSVAQVCVKSHSIEDDEIIIGAKCITYQEIEEQVEYLKKELDSIKKRSKTRFLNAERSCDNKTHRTENTRSGGL